MVRKTVIIVNVFACLVIMAMPGFVSAFTNDADTVYTYVPSDGIGNIVVRIECPAQPRYTEGAPVVVEVGTWFVSYNNFHRVNDTKRIGAVTLSYLWPGRLDAETGLQSDGVYDYGGPVSLAALKDVIRFALGLTPDVDGRYISEVVTVPLVGENVGLFASSHSGVVATNVLAYFGEEIPTVKYLVGRENPTREEMYPLEIGYFDGAPSEQNKVLNPFFREDLYSPDTVIVDYSTVGWYQPQGEAVGRPYFAAKGAIPQHILGHDKIPQMWNKRYYSRAITHALLDNGALTLENWPEYLATPAETDAHWPYRIAVYNYPAIGSKLPDLKVMLVFSRYDHVQAATTKPHIHQAWDGFHFGAHLWVRMNPDRAYVRSVDENYGLAFPDNLANREPGNWIYIEDWGFPTDSRVREDVWLASVAEMADRVHMNNWDENLDEVFFPVLLESEATEVKNTDLKKYIPETYRLLPNYPNPFNPATTVTYEIAETGWVRVSIYNLNGQEIAVLQNGSQSPGRYTLVWHARDRLNQPVAGGIYFCILQASHLRLTRKLLLLK